MPDQEQPREGHPRLIETLPRRGYRFIAPVQSAVEAAAPLPEVHSPSLSTLHIEVTRHIKVTRACC
jgi:DNA-binding winged helix-turn-helix (wHTH) protein